MPKYSHTQENEAPIYTLLVPVRKNIHPLKTFKKSVKSLKDNRKNFPLTSPVTGSLERWQATEELKKEVLDLRKAPTPLLAGQLKKIFSAGWCVKDILTALEQDPSGEVYQTPGAGGTSSALAWLHVQVNAWKTEEGVLPPSPTLVAHARARAERAQLVEQQKRVLEELRAPRVVPVHGLEQVRLMREFLRVKNRKGLVEAARLYPDQAQLIAK